MLSIKDFSSFILIVAAMHDIAVAEINWPLKTVVTLIVFTITLSAMTLPPLVRTALGMPGKAVLTKIYTLTMEHQFFVRCILFAA